MNRTTVATLRSLGVVLIPVSEDEAVDCWMRDFGLGFGYASDPVKFRSASLQWIPGVGYSRSTGFRPLHKAQGVHTLPGTRGPGLYRSKGPCPSTRSKGPGSSTKSKGPGPSTRSKGPGPSTRSTGFRPLHKAQGVQVPPQGPRVQVPPQGPRGPGSSTRSKGSNTPPDPRG